MVTSSDHSQQQGCETFWIIYNIDPLHWNIFHYNNLTITINYMYHEFLGLHSGTTQDYLS